MSITRPSFSKDQSIISPEKRHTSSTKQIPKTAETTGQTEKNTTGLTCPTSSTTIAGRFIDMCFLKLMNIDS